MRNWKYVLLAIGGLPLFAAAIGWIGSWITSGEDVVHRNTQLAGIQIGGGTPEDVAAAIQRLADSFPEKQLVIHTTEGDLSTRASEFGLGINREATVRAAMSVGKEDRGPLRPLRWLKSFLAPRIVPVQLTLDANIAEQRLIEMQGERRVSMAEPKFLAAKSGVSMVPGVVGKAIDLNQLAASIPRNIESVSEPITVTLEPTIITPTISDAAVQAIVDQAQRATAGPFTLRVLDRSIEVAPERIRTGFEMNIEGTSVSLGFRQQVVEAIVKAELRPTANATGVKFDMTNGAPTPVRGADAVQCCGADAPQRMVDALLAGKDGADIEARTVSADEGIAWAQSLGVKEVVGEFTTKHPCCAARVKNIHRISDMTRGLLIPPGETFSANDFVGKRSPDKGFVKAGVIENGEFVDDYGGGVSQWATTTFNAAFFAGLPIPDSKAHSYYLDRYPFGREATLAWPSVDLKITNNTPYGIVIWTSYTQTSVTVQLWSTKFATGEQTGSKSSAAKCGDVTVERTITRLSDGAVTKDSFDSYYNCDKPAGH